MSESSTPPRIEIGDLVEFKKTTAVSFGEGSKTHSEMMNKGDISLVVGVEKDSETTKTYLFFSQRHLKYHKWSGFKEVYICTWFDKV